MKSIAEYRRAIDQLDNEIASLLKRRVTVVSELQEMKRAEGLAAKDEKREREIFERVLGQVPPNMRDMVYGIYERVFNQSRGVIETIARGVCVANGKVLLCKAKGGTSTYLPGGHIEFGEHGSEALIREIKEELGMDATVGEFLGVVENAFLQHGRPHCEINLIYRLELPASSIEQTGAVQALEPWIEFEWRDLADLAGANLLPKEMEQYVVA